MANLEAVLEAAQTLSHDERRRLIIELDALEAMEHAGVPPSREPLASLRALSGSAHSGFADISTDKYTHVAAAVLDSAD
jgi:hypothetical protein